MLPEVDDFCRLVLLRHPELAPSHAATVVGDGDAPLGRRGLARARRWVDDLRPLAIDAVFAADVRHGREAGQVLAEGLGLELRTEPRLRDQAMGAWQGRGWQELAASEGEAVGEFFARFGEGAAPGGESLGAAVERVLAFWQEISPRALSQTVALVMAGNLICGFAAAMLGMRLSRAVSLSLPHGASGVLDVFRNGVRIAAWHPEALRDDVA